MSCTPKSIFSKSALIERIRFNDGATSDIIKVIMDMDSVSDKYVDQEAAQCLTGATDYATLRNVWEFVKSNLKYKADSRGREVVKSPAALFEIGRGDCKSFSIAVAALLRALGFDGIRYRFAAYDKGQEVTHVYVVVKSGGKDVILDAVHTRFDEQVKYAFKRDVIATQAAKIGILRPSSVPQKNIIPVLALGLVAWLYTKK